MNVLILGSGGREHALAWKIAQSPMCDRLWIAPGNAGTAQVGTNLAIKVGDFQAIKQAVLDHAIDFVVVGPEDPLVNGIYDFFRGDPQLARVAVFGPSRQGATLEGSKEYAKEFMLRHGYPRLPTGVLPGKISTKRMPSSTALLLRMCSRPTVWLRGKGC